MFSILIKPLHPGIARIIKLTLHFEKSDETLIPEHYRVRTSTYINGTILDSIATGKQSLGMTEQADYVNSKLPAIETRNKKS